MRTSEFQPGDRIIWKGETYEMADTPTRMPAGSYAVSMKGRSTQLLPDTEWLDSDDAPMTGQPVVWHMVERRSVAREEAPDKRARARWALENAIRKLQLGDLEMAKALAQDAINMLDES
jgi:hypothetical protein